MSRPEPSQATHRTGTAAIGKNVNINVYGGALAAKSGESQVAIEGGTITPGEGIAVYKGYYPDGDQPGAENLSDRTEDGNYVRTQNMTIREGHYHDFVYAGEGNTITATCVRTGDDVACSLDNKTVSLKLVRPTLTVYNGAGDPKVIMDNYSDFVQHTHQNITQDSIKYYELKDGSTIALNSSEGAPTKVGSYMAVLELPSVKTNSAQSTFGTVRATVSYTIEKATVEITTPPTASEITYGQTLADSNNFTGAVVNPNIEGTFTWANPRIQPAVSDSGNTKYTVIFTPTGEYADNYETATCEVTLVVNPAAPTVAAPVALNPTYNGEEQALVSKGSAEHGIMLYALGTQPETDEGWQNSVPTATDAGDYTVWYKVFGDPNYSDTEPASVTAKIEKADSSGTVTGIEGLVYNTTEQALVIPGEHLGGELQYFVGADEPTDENQWEDEIPAETNAGDYTNLNLDQR